jgi:pilus assembly protein CpaC
MYENQLAQSRSARRPHLAAIVACAVTAAFASTLDLRAQDAAGPDSVVRKISGLSEKLEITTNTSRILTLDKNIPRVQVNNPELLAVTPLSATQVQISAKKAGVTQVNLWDDAGGIHTVDIQIYGDARELQVALATQFPNSSIRVYRYSESLVLTGFVDRPDFVGPMMRLAEDYAPKVINNINVGGVQQILLRVKVMEVSRTKLRQLSTDFAAFGRGGGFFASAPSGLLQTIDNTTEKVTALSPRNGPASASFGIVHNGSAFFGFLDWLQQNQCAKILAEPNIVAVSGRPAQFQDGGEIPVPVPQSLGTTTIEFKPFGTIVDFLPIVLGNGNIRLEVRPQVVETDYSRAITVAGITIPAFNTRKVDTAVEMKAGQTFALAGLVQEITTTSKSGLPYVSDLPVIGVPFRKTSDNTEETELLIVVTPDFVDPIEACQYEGQGPGMFTTSPTDRGLYCAGQMEVPLGCNPTKDTVGSGKDPCGNCGGCSTCNGGCSSCGNGAMGGMNPVATPSFSNSVVLPGGTGYDDSQQSSSPMRVIPNNQVPQPTLEPARSAPMKTPNELPSPQKGAQSLPDDISLPVEVEDHSAPPAATRAIPVATPKTAPAPAPLPPQAPTPPAAPVPVTPVEPSADDAAIGQGGAPVYTTPRPYSPQRQPVFLRNASRPYNPQAASSQAPAAPRQGALIGPVGYDVQ